MSRDEKGRRRGAGRGGTPVSTETPTGRAGLDTGGEAVEPRAPTTGGRFRGRARGTAGAQGEAGSPEGRSPTGGTPSGSPDRRMQELTEKFKKAKLVEILAPRTSYGTLGKKVGLLVNHFEIFIPTDLEVVQYHIDITHIRLRLNRDEKREIFWKVVAANQNIFGTGLDRFRIAFDGDHICITQKQLKFPQVAGVTPGTYAFEYQTDLTRFDRRNELVKVKFQLVGFVEVNVEDAHNVAATPSTEDVKRTSTMNILDIIFRQGRSDPMIQGEKLWYPWGATIYKIPENAGTNLGYGQEIWHGLYGGSRVGETKLFVNFDVSHSSFYKSTVNRRLPVLQFMLEVINSEFRAGLTPRDFNPDATLNDNWAKTFNKEIKNLQIVYHAPGTVGDKQFRVSGLAKTNAITTTFGFRDPMTNTERQITVAQYYQERYQMLLQFPKLQLLMVGKGKRVSHLPMEKCAIMPCQRVNKKLYPQQTSDMIKAAAINAPNRMNKIKNLVDESKFTVDDWCQMYGVRINTNMSTVQGRILPAPRIQYGGLNGAARGGGMVMVKDGVWDLRGQKFYQPADGFKKFGCILLEPNNYEAQKFGDFFSQLLQTCSDFGMRVPHTVQASDVRFINPADAQTQLEPKILELKAAGCELIFVTLPQKNAPQYAEVKRAAEIVCGIITQCVTKQNCMKKDRNTMANLALKINTKLGGINWRAEMDATAKGVLFEKPTLVLGVDITHPGPGDTKTPSIAAIVGNLDNTFMKYAASVRVQKHRREAVIYLQEPVRERIYEYFMSGQGEESKVPQVKPERIIIYRDGVAEGQFAEVLKDELSGVREACRSLGEDYKPSVTFIVGQKRHHTRFFPTAQNQSSGRAFNIFPGTVVDREITHPKIFEFYLCSHQGIQGTSRPIRYHVITDDSAFAGDQIQVVTHYLAHCYARCTRSVSIPAPVYYADLAARRARAHLHDKIDFSTETMEHASSVSEETLTKGSTVAPEIKLKMYFS